MTELFLRLVNNSINAGWLILAVLVLRILLRRAPKRVRPWLWGLVGLRLLVPLSWESAMSLLPTAETIPLDIAQRRRLPSTAESVQSTRWSIRCWRPACSLPWGRAPTRCKFSCPCSPPSGFWGWPPWQPMPWGAMFTCGARPPRRYCCGKTSMRARRFPRLLCWGCSGRKSSCPSTWRQIRRSWSSPTKRRTSVAGITGGSPWGICSWRSTGFNPLCGWPTSCCAGIWSWPATKR